MEKDSQQCKYKVPQDIVIDILRIVFRNNVKYSITGVKERENSLLLTVNYAGIKNRVDVKNNIEGILDDYCQYMKGIISDNTLVMDLDDDDD